MEKDIRKNQILKKVASAACVGALSLGAFAMPADLISNYKVRSLVNSNVVYAQTIENHEYAVELWSNGVFAQGYADLASAFAAAAEGI